MAEPLIRPRHDDDLPSCVRTLEAVHRADGYPSVWPARPELWLTPPELLGAWVAADGPALLGHVALTRADPALAAAVGRPSGQLAAVARLFVDRSARRGGLAAALLERAARAAAGAGRQPVLEVESGAAAAISLYERAGWRFVGSGPGGWSTADGQPAVVRTYLGPG
ncbi:GNAT family N-acetyltransferase [Kitasatospora sp. NPDC004531]